MELNHTGHLYSTFYICDRLFEFSYCNNPSNVNLYILFVLEEFVSILSFMHVYRIVQNSNSEPMTYEFKSWRM